MFRCRIPEKEAPTSNKNIPSRNNRLDELNIHVYEHHGAPLPLSSVLGPRIVDSIDGPIEGFELEVAQNTTAGIMDQEQRRAIWIAWLDEGWIRLVFHGWTRHKQAEIGTRKLEGRERERERERARRDLFWGSHCHT